MKSYLDTKQDKDCCGCRACEHICPVNAIKMVSNKEGFKYPYIDEDICISCNKCRKVCPMNKNYFPVDDAKIYAAQNKDLQKLMNSSSGGVFITFAEKIIEDNGIVFGSTFDSKFEANQTYTNNFLDLFDMQGSKYVQSDTKDSYKRTKDFLENNKKVLYTGTPCQISGLKNYLEKDYKNLFTLDFLCHGVPSPKMFQEYIKSIEDKKGGKINSFSFRDKSLKGWGLVVSYEVESNKHIKKYYESGRLSSYLYGFTKDYFNRLSCYKCPHKGRRHESDITVADYWGIENYHKQFNFQNGTSILIVNSPKGHKLIEAVRDEFIMIETDFSFAEVENSGLRKKQEDVEIPYTRSIIYDLLKERSYKELEKVYLKDPNHLKLLVISKLPRRLVTCIKNLKS